MSAHASDLNLSLGGSILLEADRVEVFSKIAATPALKCGELNLMSAWEHDEDPQSTRVRMLQWMSFAFFSRFSLNSITQVDIWINGLSRRDAATVTEIVSSENPLQMLLNSSEAQCKTAQLLEDVELLDTVGPDASDPTALSSGAIVWVVHNRQDSPTMEVLVPGYGVHGIEKTKLSNPTVPPLAPPVLDLAIMLDEYEDEEDNLEGLVPLLEVIGAHTMSLTINMQPEDLDIDATSIPDILHACPRLQYLEMEHVTCDGLECLVDAFEDDECQLTALNLNGVMCGDDTESLDMVFDALKVSDTRIAMQLQELHIRTNTSNWMSTARFTRLS
ncbi:hypothetical protein Poli38472_011195 [Pythium oligandrum]|uniref:Uncharacterized protein n=1 Tax=Pythium oligandrum TaxID=41045 RepID=A0A8K1FKW7_PYTOL|nr:hypothetical protein Poli38472_011195 [Pythium oligandrum]|eukprot:TMW67575.1 hypothetical protein Poli38472_011195 [Pythium oligandrum]